jgi:type VI secretion system secreted protein VgrG
MPNWIKKYGWMVALIVIPITATTIYFIYRKLSKLNVTPIVTDIPDTSQDTSMQDIISFIKSHEGGWVNDPSDSGGETNKGVIYKTWCSVFGTNHHDRFMAMNNEDWYAIFKPNFWDKIRGDDIQSTAVANFLVDWFWGSGSYAIGLKYHGVQYGVQPVLNSLGASLVVDGDIGKNTLDAINSTDANTLLQALHDNRLAFYNSLADNSPKDQKFLTGWINRLNDLT